MLNTLLRTAALAAFLGSPALLGCAASPVDPQYLPDDLLGSYDPQGCAETALRRTTSDPALLPESAEVMMRGCSVGESDSCSIAGVMYELGRGVRADRARAQAFYQRACEKGNARGCGNLGEMKAADGDEAAAMPLLARACDAGKGRACVTLGRLQAKAGAREKANALFERACSCNEATGCLELAEVLDHSTTPGDRVKASELVRRACARGDATACDRLSKVRLALIPAR